MTRLRAVESEAIRFSKGCGRGDGMVSDLPKIRHSTARRFGVRELPSTPC